ESAAPISGVASVADRWFAPTWDSERIPRGTPMLFRPAFFKAAVERVRAGRRAAVLNVAHSGEVLCSTRDGCLSLSLDGDYLRPLRRGCTAGGRAAMWVLRHVAARELSVGVRDVELIEYRRGDVIDRVVITDGDIHEISVVAKGACPGARLL